MVTWLFFLWLKQNLTGQVENRKAASKVFFLSLLKQPHGSKEVIILSSGKNIYPTHDGIG